LNFGAGEEGSQRHLLEMVLLGESSTKWGENGQSILIRQRGVFQPREEEEVPDVAKTYVDTIAGGEDGARRGEERVKVPGDAFEEQTHEGDTDLMVAVTDRVTGNCGMKARQEIGPGAEGGINEGEREEEGCQNILGDGDGKGGRHNDLESLRWRKVEKDLKIKVVKGGRESN